MKFPILKEERLPGTIDRDRITIETSWGPMADRIPGHRKQQQSPIATFYHIYRVEIKGDQS